MIDKRVDNRPRYNKEEFARRGEQLYEEKIREQVQSASPHAFVAIDLESGDFEVDEKSLAATKRLLIRHPDAQIWMRRVASKIVWRFRVAFETQRASMQ